MPPSSGPADAVAGGALRQPTDGASPRVPVLVLVTLLAPPLLPADAAAQETGGYDYPSGSTPPEVACRMLEMAGVGPTDTIYDLGSGEGAIVIVAAREFGATAVGIEIDSSLVAASRRSAREAGVEERVRFVHANFYEVDLRPATVVTTYLLPGTMNELQPHLLRELGAGTRIVSHDFDMDRWPADSTAGWWGGVGGRTTLFLWTVPARVGGTWTIRIAGGDSLRVRIDQNFQRLRATSSGGGEVEVREARVAGDSVRFRLSGSRIGTVVLRGTASMSRMSGRTDRDDPWRARRVAFSDSSLVAWASP